MNESEWLTSTDPREMLSFVVPRASDRKWRLFACACCRRVWNPFVAPLTVRAVMAAEAAADGRLSAAEHARVAELARHSAIDAQRFSVPDFHSHANSSGYFAHVATAALYACDNQPRIEAELSALHCAWAVADLPY